MMNARDDDKKTAADDRPDEDSSPPEKGKDKSNADETDTGEKKRFERSDNLRRRSEWFQKRTGGR